MKFRVLHGQHLEEVRLPDGRMEIRTYPQGSIIETDVDLVEKFSPWSKVNPDFPSKFQRLPDDFVGDSTHNSPSNSQAGPNTAAPQTAVVGGSADASKTLESMSFKELQQWAAAEEINLKGAKSKEEIIRVLKNTGVIK